MIRESKVSELVLRISCDIAQDDLAEEFLHNNTAFSFGLMKTEWGYLIVNMSAEQIIMIASAVITLLLLIFAVDWRYFRDWVVVFFFKNFIDFLWGSPVVELKLLEYPIRLLPKYYNTSILFECWVFPVLCILYNQVTREKGLWPIIYYALLFSAGMTAIEYPLEKYTDLIKYLKWSWFTTFYTLTITFLSSRAFIAFFRWGCNYFTRK